LPNIKERLRERRDMEESKGKIEKLDFILEKLLQGKGYVISNDLHASRLYEVYKNDINKIKEDFSNLQSEFYKANASEKLAVQDDELICYSTKTTEFKKEYGGFENYYLKLAEKKKEDKVEEDKKEVIENQKNAMVNHNYWVTRPINVIVFTLSMLAFFVGINSLEDIKDYFQKDKEKVQTQHQESKIEEEEKIKQPDSLAHKSGQIELTELNTEYSYS
jgi:hypothetical protein